MMYRNASTATILPSSNQNENSEASTLSSSSSKTQQTRTLKHLQAGSIAAFVSTLICHPIDVLRTQLQTQAVPTTARECINRIVKTEGFQGFYKGLSAPLIAQAFYKAIIFGVNSKTQEVLLQRRLDKKVLDHVDIFVCGAVAGTINAFVVSPVELVRNRLVVLESRPTFHGPVGCVKDILKNDGLLGLWRGIVPTLWRDGLGVGAWFMMFNLVKENLSEWKAEKQGTKSLGLQELLLAGSAAGLAYWVIALPFDTIKSLVQVVPSSKGSFSMWEVAFRLIREEGGVSRLFRGWQGAFSRAIPGSAATLATYELIKDKL